MLFPPPVIHFILVYAGKIRLFTDRSRLLARKKEAAARMPPEIPRFGRESFVYITSYHPKVHQVGKSDSRCHQS